jgi:hypothetical protein
VRFFVAAILAILTLSGRNLGAQPPEVEQAAGGRPASFPERIWAACDFELLRHDVLWGGSLETENIPLYPANSAAVAAREIAPGVSLLNVLFSAYPRAEAATQVYFRYYIEGADRLELRLWNLDRGGWHRITLTGLRQGVWAEATADFLNVDCDSGGWPIRSGERVSELAFVVHGGGRLLVDDIICFSAGSPNDSPPEKFPRRVVMAWGFDPLDYYHPWTHTDYRVNHEHESLFRNWGAAEGLGEDGKGFKRVRLIIDPPQHVGEHTRARYRYYLENVRRVQSMIFDLSDGDNRHLGLEGLPQGSWLTQTLDFTTDGIKNDGNQTPFEAGSLVDDLFFLAWPSDSGKPYSLLLDDIVLYDAYE